MEEMLITAKELEQLGEYSHSFPTGAFAGKRWKRKNKDGWIVGQYEESEEAGKLKVVWYIPVCPYEKVKQLQFDIEAEKNERESIINKKEEEYDELERDLDETNRNRFKMEQNLRRICLLRGVDDEKMFELIKEAALYFCEIDEEVPF